MVKKCKLCGRKIKANKKNPGYHAGYGPVCYQKVQPEMRVQVAPNAEIVQLRHELETIKKQLFALQMVPQPTLAVVPNGQSTPKQAIPLMVGGWDPSELQENPLFLKMQMVCEVA